MASSKHSQRDDDSNANASDELHEMKCESCQKDGDNAIAIGFCVNCVEYLCKTCLKYHRKLKPGHVLQNQESMPQDFCSEKCPHHVDDIIKFYCRNCDEFLCPKCVEHSHKSCKGIMHLPQIVKGLEKQEEFKQFVRKFKKLKMEMTKAKDKIKSTNEAIEKLSTATRATIKEHFGELKKKIDQLETTFDSSVEEIRLKDEINISSFSTKYYTLHENLQKLESDINQQRNSNERCRLFMAVKKAEKEIVLIEKGLKTVTDGSTFVKYAFQPTNILGDMLADAGKLGSFTILDSEKKKEAKFVRSLNVKSQNDVKVCYITGVCVLSDSLLVVSDCMNKTVKSIDSERNFIRSVLLTDGWPSVVTKVKDNQVAVTLPEKGKIEFISVDKAGSMSKERLIKTEGECRAIEYSQGNLIVTFTNPAKVQIIDMSGAVLKSFSKDSAGDNLFIHPYYLALSPDHKIIYVSDNMKLTVTSLSRDGNVVATFHDDGLAVPWGITTDESGAVYVCGVESYNIYQLSDDLKKVHVLKEDIESPHCLKFYGNTNKLYLTHNFNSLKVFQLQ